MKVHAIAAVAAAAALAACSPYRLSASVSSMRASVAASQQMLNEGLDSYRREALSRQAARFVFTRARLQTSPGCGFSSARDDKGVLLPPCAIMERGAPDPVIPEVIANEREARRKMAVLLRYVSGLEAVTNSADSAALTEATDQLAGAASALPTAALPLAASPQAGAAAAAAGVTIATAIKLGGTFARIALDYERLATLRRAVNETQGPVRTVATGIGSNLEALREARYSQVFGEGNLRTERVGEGPPARYAADYQAAQNRISDANALRDGEGSAVGLAIAEAHDKLILAANDRSAGAAEFAKAVGDLADAVTALRASMATAKSTQSGT